MNDNDQKQRERVSKIWEDEGRPEGAHDDNWRRAAEAHELTENVIKANQQADDEFAKDDREPKAPSDIKSPSAVNQDQGRLA